LLFRGYGTPPQLPSGERQVERREPRHCGPGLCSWIESDQFEVETSTSTSGRLQMASGFDSDHSSTPLPCLSTSGLTKISSPGSFAASIVSAGANQVLKVSRVPVG